MSKFTKQYRNFFLESDAGDEFIKNITNMIQSKHESAENDPEHARDYVQQSKGMREVVNFIQSLVADKKKGKTPR